MADGPNARFVAEFKNLCTLVAELVLAKDAARALVYSVAYLVLSDANRYTWISKASKSADSIAQKVIAFETALPERTAISGGNLEGFFRDDPAALVAWLDRRLTAADGIDPEAPQWSLPNSVLSVAVDLHGLSNMGIPLAPHLTRLFLLPRRRDGLVAPVERQTHDLHRFSKRWLVLSETPDPRRPDRKIQISNLESAFLNSFEVMKDRREVSIYLAEFAVAPIFESTWGTKGDWKEWSAVGLKNEAELIEVAEYHILNAVQKRAQVVVFPELVVSPGILEVIKAELRRLAVDRDYPIAMVAAGSFHIMEGSQKFNVCAVLDGCGEAVKTMSGDQLIHRKLTSVELATADGDVLEGNVPGHVLPIFPSAIGLQGLLICLDLAQKASVDKLPLTSIPYRWLWVPSMSKTVSAHRDRASDVCLHQATTVACANQADAVFAERLEIKGGADTSFLWSSKGRSSEAFDPNSSGKNHNGGHWKFFTVELQEERPSYTRA